MTSTRNKALVTSREPAPEAAREELLDAARECVIAVGLRRTTLTDVARRAGVSRMTMYRRFPDMRALVAELMTREWTEVAGAAVAAAEGPSARRRFVAAVVDCVRGLRAHPMFRRILELDPEILLPYLVRRRGASQDRMLALLVEAITEGRGDGSLRAADAGLLARTVMLAAYGFVLSQQTMTDGVAEADLDAQLDLLLDRFLAP